MVGWADVLEVGFPANNNYLPAVAHRLVFWFVSFVANGHEHKLVGDLYIIDSDGYVNFSTACLLFYFTQITIQIFS